MTHPHPRPPPSGLDHFHDPDHFDGDGGGGNGGPADREKELAQRLEEESAALNDFHHPSHFDHGYEHQRPPQRGSGRPQGPDEDTGELFPWLISAYFSSLTDFNNWLLHE